MFVDASAILAILNDEPEANAFIDALDVGTDPITSPIAVFEATIGLSRVRHATIEDAAVDVAEFLALAGVDCQPLTVEDGHAALAAFARYGKGRGHPAQLNLADCFAYAAAHRRDRSLLFKGNDFSQTDIAAAVATPRPA